MLVHGLHWKLYIIIIFTYSSGKKGLVQDWILGRRIHVYFSFFPFVSFLLKMTYPKPSSLSMRHPSMSLLLILACDGLVDKRLMMHEVLYRVSTMHSPERGFQANDFWVMQSLKSALVSATVFENRQKISQKLIKQTCWHSCKMRLFQEFYNMVSALLQQETENLLSDFISV